MMLDKTYLNYVFKFVCPRCGGTHYGSSELADGSLMRYCHGIAHSSRGCGYTWHQTEDEQHVYLAYLSVKEHLAPKADEATQDEP